MFNGTLIGLGCIGVLLLGLTLIFQHVLSGMSMVQIADKGIKGRQMWKELDKRPDKKPDACQQGKQ